MIGAVIGDIVGSPYEFNQNNIKTTVFPLFSDRCEWTDDTVMAAATAKTLLEINEPEKSIDEIDFKNKLIDNYKAYGKIYHDAGYGPRFYTWLDTDSRDPIGSCGNGSAMRVSPVGWVFNTLEETEKVAKWSAEITHDHPDGIAGAQATAAAIWMARNGKNKKEIYEYINNKYYSLNFTLDSIRPTYKMTATCATSVPHAIRAFIEGNTFEDCIRLAVSIGGDSDTIACITGSIAEAYYHIPDNIIKDTMERIYGTTLSDPIIRFDRHYCHKNIDEYFN